jgi:hypothetical protein
VIYLDSSVALAQLLAEARSPPDWLRSERLVSSRLLEYEVWNRLYARGCGQSHAGETRTLLARVDLIDMDRAVLARSLKPFPIPVRTLDGFHLATIEFLRAQGDSVELASYDNRLLTAARALGVPLAAL